MTTVLFKKNSISTWLWWF